MRSTERYLKVNFLEEPPIWTYVDGDFEGCDYDKMIPFENGLLFKCRTYRYHYAYHPRVMIVGNYVTIDGEKYEGQLYRK